MGDDEISLEEFTGGLSALPPASCSFIIRLRSYGVSSLVWHPKLLILEGISGTGKTSLPYSFSRYMVSGDDRFNAAVVP